MTERRRATDHLPQPSVPGEVVRAPVYVRVRTGWLEKALFIAVFVQIMMTLLFLLVGSQPARQLVDENRFMRMMLCDVVQTDNPVKYAEYQARRLCG